MIIYKEIAFTAYAVTDISRAREFYEGVLGLTPNAPVSSDDPRWIEYNVGPGTLGIGRSERWLPSRDGASAALEVVNFEEAVDILKAHEVEIEMGPLETPVCHMIVVRDPDGNKITLHRRKAV